MSEETTQHLPSSAEERIMPAIAEMRDEMNEKLAEMRIEMNERFTAIETEVAATHHAFNTRISSLEEQAAERARETRQIWDEVLASVKKIDSKLGVIALDLLDQRREIELLKKQLPRFSALKSF
jgi:hypothetical protein